MTMTTTQKFLSLQVGPLAGVLEHFVRIEGVLLEELPEVQVEGVQGVERDQVDQPVGVAEVGQVTGVEIYQL